MEKWFSEMEHVDGEPTDICLECKKEKPVVSKKRHNDFGVLKDGDYLKANQVRSCLRNSRFR
jgi:hypothetical protein